MCQKLGRLVLVIILLMEPIPPSLGAQIAGLRSSALAQERYVWIPAAIHALIIACLARIFASLERLVALWQSGLLPPPQPSRPSRTPRPSCPRPSRRRTPGLRRVRPRSVSRNAARRHTVHRLPSRTANPCPIPAPQARPAAFRPTAFRPTTFRPHPARAPPLARIVAKTRRATSPRHA